MEYRYLVYAIDKHQNAPSFRNDLPDWLLENANSGTDVIVDLKQKTRLWCGEWKPVDCYPKLPDD